MTTAQATPSVLSEKVIVSMEDKITKLLRGTNRHGMDSMIAYLEEAGFFTSPASTKYHDACPGGLAKHSLRVFELMVFYQVRFPWLDRPIAVGQRPYNPLTNDNIIIASLLHDVCKAGAYIGDEAPYKWNKGTPTGHAEFSISIITRHIVLEPLERLMIRFHMGPYGCEELYEPGSWEYRANAEYPLRSHRQGPKPSTTEEKERDKAVRYGKSLRNAWYHNPVVKFIYFADEIATAEAMPHE